MQTLKPPFFCLKQLLQYFRNTLSIVVLKYHDVGHRLVGELHVFHQLQSYELMVAADADIESDPEFGINSRGVRMPGRLLVGAVLIRASCCSGVPCVYFCVVATSVWLSALIYAPWLQMLIEPTEHISTNSVTMCSNAFIQYLFSIARFRWGSHRSLRR